MEPDLTSPAARTSVDSLRFISPKVLSLPRCLEQIPHSPFPGGSCTALFPHVSQK